LIRSFIALQNVSPGFRADGVLTARVQPSGPQYSEPHRVSGFYTDALSRIAVLPGVQTAAGISYLPMAGPGIGTSFHRADRAKPAAGESAVTDVRPVTPGFFTRMGIPGARAAISLPQMKPVRRPSPSSATRCTRRQPNDDSPSRICCPSWRGCVPGPSCCRLMTYGTSQRLSKSSRRCGNWPGAEGCVRE
jgi:hypothetical protein